MHTNDCALMRIYFKPITLICLVVTMASCGKKAHQPGPEQRTLSPAPATAAPAQTGLFTLNQICKAGLSVMYGRDPNIMSAVTNEDQVQVKYTRPTDGKAMSYRCKLEQGLILTWDDSIAGARWYGLELGDSKLEYRIIGDQLIVRDMIKGEISSEKACSSTSINK
jgi:hypothetical protein